VDFDQNEPATRRFPERKTHPAADQLMVMSC
jgi:hypothetical protein